MCDGCVAVLERDQARSRRLSELLEFAHFEPIPVSSSQALQKLDPRDCVAAIVGLQQDVDSSVFEGFLRGQSEIPIVALGPKEASANGVDRQDPRFCAYVPEPIRYRELVEALDRAKGLRSGQALPRRFPVGTSSAVKELDDQMKQVAGYDTTVLIQGESGSGKELVAQRIHALSSRRDGPFVPLNCSAVPKELLESELFGHEKGAFTGAITSRIGRFELAEAGTLFLDEIGDMSAEMQVKLLRVLQERVFERVGSTKQRKANVRVIAATHRDLAALVNDGQFREDLFFRVHVFPVRVPPLRERAEDFEDLIDDLQENREIGRPRIEFDDSAMSALREYSWPGNVRELANLIERLAIVSPSRLVQAADLPAPYGAPASSLRDLAERPAGVRLDLKAHLKSIERELIQRALEETDGTVAHAAKLLNLQRTTLVEKLRKHGL